MDLASDPELEPVAFERGVRDAVDSTGFRFESMRFARRSQRSGTARKDAHVWSVTIKARSAPELVYDDATMRAALATVNIELGRSRSDTLTRSMRETTLVGLWRASA